MPPGAMPPGGPPPAGGVNPEVEAMLGQVLGGMEQMATVLEQEKAEKAEMAQKLEEMHSRMIKMESAFSQGDTMPAGV